jgi:hypothetical protein
MVFAGEKLMMNCTLPLFLFGVVCLGAAFASMFYLGPEVSLWTFAAVFPLIFVGVSLIAGVLADWAGANGQEHL